MTSPTYAGDQQRGNEDGFPFCQMKRAGLHEVWRNGGYSGPGGDGPEWAGSFQGVRLFAMAGSFTEAKRTCQEHADKVAASPDAAAEGAK